MGNVDGYSMVISGIWKCCENGEWSFNVDKERQSRVVPVADGVTLRGLVEVVKKEFGETSSSAAQLSYWAPSSLSFATGKKTPPVMVTTDVGLDYYLKLAKVNKGLNMFVNFPGRSKRENESKGSAEGVVEGHTSSDSRRKRMCGTDEVLGDVSTAGSKVAPLVSDNDNIDVETIRILEDLSSGRLNLEDDETTKGKNGGPIVSEVEGLCSTEDDDLSSCDDVMPSPVEEVAPEGYDKEFWGNFIEEELGGSNAVEVMCSGNGAFDHMVIVGGGVSAKPDGEDGNVHHKGECSDPGGQVEVVGNRKLEDIDDEEFDIPPLFDDTEYERTEIPDLDRDDGNGIYKGKVFATKEDCQIGLAIYAIKNMFHFRQSVTKRNYFVCICTDEKCDWRVRADEMVESGYYEIRKAQLEHRCSIETRKHYMKKATSRVIAAVYKAQYSEPVKGPKPMDLQQLVLENLRVSASYSKCRRAREKAVEEIQGGDGDSYTKLAEYLHLLKIANPGTVTDIVTDIEDDGSERFVYMFLAFGASIAGFKHVRRILVVDGTHLTGRYKGVLLTACGQDANFQVFPLAFAIVDSENDDSWTWFFQKIERILADSPGLSIISDRHQSIYVAKSRVYPMAHHGACIAHIERNVTARFKSKGLAKMVVNAACEYKVAGFNKIYKDIKSRNNECALYLEKIGLAHWTRVYFRGERYNLMTSNICESLNKALKGGRGSPILELLKFIRSMLTRWFSARRKKSGKTLELIPPYVDKIMTKNMLKMSGSKIVSVSSWSYEIVGQFGEKHHVLLDDKRCSCKGYDKLKIPCGHGLMAATDKGVPFGTLVGDYFKSSTWAATYLGVVNPEADESEVEVPAEIREREILPPRTRTPSGRPRLLRISSVGEIRKPRTTRVKLNRCTRCKGTGHNRSRCKNPI